MEELLKTIGDYVKRQITELEKSTHPAEENQYDPIIKMIETANSICIALMKMTPTMKT